MAEQGVPIKIKLDRDRFKRFKLPHWSRRVAPDCPLEEHASASIRAASPPATCGQAEAAELCTDDLALNLTVMLNRVLVVELHAARLDETLQGETSEERFADFARRLREPAVATEILERFPVLARQLAEPIDRWANVSAEVLERLATDHDAIRRRLVANDLGRLCTVRGSSGDSHRGGRSVHILTFDRGARVVYKPRPPLVYGPSAVFGVQKTRDWRPNKSKLPFSAGSAPAKVGLLSSPTRPIKYPRGKTTADIKRLWMLAQKGGSVPNSATSVSEAQETNKV